LFLFLVGLGPGYIYVRATERFKTRAERSEVMEVAELVLVGAACTGLVSSILLPIMVKADWVQVGSLVTGPGGYIAQHPVRSLTALLVVLAASYGLAYAGARFIHKGESEAFNPDRSVWVQEITQLLAGGADGLWATIELQDGRVVYGWLSSYTPDVNGDANRDLALTAPIRVVANGEQTTVPADRWIVAADEIRYLSLTAYRL
jgi:hypothetical protein